MLVTGLLKAVTLFCAISIGNLTLSSKSRFAIKFRKFLKSLSCKSGEKVASSSESMSDELPEPSKSCPEELAKSVSSLDWIIKLSQRKDLVYSRLWADYNWILADFGDCKLDKDDTGSIVKAVNRLFNNIMTSDSLADKMRALQAVDPLLTDKTTKRLIEECFENLNDLSNALEFLTVDGIKTIDKNIENARALLGIKYDLTDILNVGLSSWFLLNQLKFYSIPLSEFKKTKDRVIDAIVKHQIVLRADVDLERLFINMRIGYEKYGNYDLISRWYRYLVNKSPFEDIELYDTQTDWEIVGKSLSLGDPRIAVDTLDAGFASTTESARIYLLFFQENPTERLIKLNPTDLDGVYSCFSLDLEIRFSDYQCGVFHKISKEKHVELANYFAEIGTMSMFHCVAVKLQQKLSYLELASLFEDDGHINMDYSRRFIRNPKTLELLDIIGARLSYVVRGRHGFTYFNRYFLMNSNWDEAVEKHFHYYISFIMLTNCQKLSKNLTDYFGISIEIDNQKILSTMDKHKAEYVDYTIDKIPRHLNSFFEIINKQDRQGINIVERLNIAIAGSIFNDEIASIAQKENFVHYTLKGKPGYFDKGPVFVDFARMRYKDKSHGTQLGAFLYFEYLVHKCFSTLARMDLEKGFQKISTNNSFSIMLKNFISENFEWRELPLVLKNSEMLKREMLKYNLEIAMGLQLERMSAKVLLKTIYESISDDRTDQRLVLAQRLFNAQLLHLGSN